MSSQRGQVVKTMAVIVRPRDGALLVSEHADPGGRLFQRPLGGHVEFGELAADALRREISEEIGQSLTDVRLLGVVENIFEWDRELAHEIVFLYAASFSDQAAYEVAEQHIRDHASDGTRVIWRAADASIPPLYPDGVAELAASVAGSGHQHASWRTGRLARQRRTGSDVAGQPPDDGWVEGWLHERLLDGAFDDPAERR